MRHMTTPEGLAERFIRDYPKAGLLFAQGSSGNEMYVVISGSVEISQAENGGERVIGIVGTGGLLGEMALVDFEPRSATARAAEDGTRVMVIDQPRFFYLVSQQPAFALAVMHVLCERIRTLERRGREGG